MLHYVILANEIKINLQQAGAKQQEQGKSIVLQNIYLVDTTNIIIHIPKVFRFTILIMPFKPALHGPVLSEPFGKAQHK